MQTTFTEKKIAKFSFYSTIAFLCTSFVTYPLNKINIRAKSNPSSSTQGIFSQFKNIYKNQSLRGLFQGASLLPFSIIPAVFAQNYVYEKLVHYVKGQSTFQNNTIIMQLLPVIGIVAVAPFTLISWVFSIAFTLIHSQKLSNIEAIKKVAMKDKRMFIQSFKASGISLLTLIGIRQFIYEHTTKHLKDKKFPHYLNLMITSTIVGLSVGLFYQPFEVILILLVVGQKEKYGNSIKDIIKKQGTLKLLTKGLRFRLLISMIMSLTSIPLYSHLKQQFNLNLYV